MQTVELTIDLSEHVGSIPRMCTVDYSNGKTKRVSVMQDCRDVPHVWVIGKRSYNIDGTPTTGRGARIVGISISKDKEVKP